MRENDGLLACMLDISIWRLCQGWTTPRPCTTQRRFEGVYRYLAVTIDIALQVRNLNVVRIWTYGC